jgi:hypothetical protein
MNRVAATRYVTPLREGGSLPAIVEADDLGLYVAKFRGAGQGALALVAEWIGCELARGLGLNVPDVVVIDVDAALGRNEPDSEIRELLLKSVGPNLGMDYLPASITFDPVVGPAPTAEDASKIVWLDAFLMNVDRTPKNPNLLCWHKALWVIDHGASLYWHHGNTPASEAAQSPFAAIKHHVLLAWATALDQADAQLRARLTPALCEDIVKSIPDEWLGAEPEAARERYRTFLTQRAQHSNLFLQEAHRARSLLV